MTKKTVSRLAIFCLYAPDGIVRFRVTYILKELSAVSEEIIIVSNGDISEHGKRLLKKYTNDLIIRENIGFDGGAYADVILNHIGKEKLQQYDEVILCNDTFWGPFVPLSDIFLKMERSDGDWWGLNKVEAGLLSYIQSYFLVFRSNALKCNAVYDFFLENNDRYSTKKVYDIYIYFELALYGYMEKKGLKNDIYTFAHNACVYESAAQCYIKYGLPILKCKALKSEYYHPEQITVLLDALSKDNQYPTDEIRKEILELYDISVEDGYAVSDLTLEETPTTIPDYTAEEFIGFTKRFSGAYLYGSGLLAQKFCYVIGNKLHNLRGFLVSDDRAISEETIMGLPVIHYSEREDNSGIIVTLNRIHSREVFDTIGNDGSMMYFFQKYN